MHISYQFLVKALIFKSSFSQLVIIFPTKKDSKQTYSATDLYFTMISNNNGVSYAVRMRSLYCPYNILIEYCINVEQIVYCFVPYVACFVMFQECFIPLVI